MKILYLLIPIALVLVFLAVRLFIWAVRSGQYDDPDTEARRILYDDEERKPEHDDPQRLEQ